MNKKQQLPEILENYIARKSDGVETGLKHTEEEEKVALIEEQKNEEELFKIFEEEIIKPKYLQGREILDSFFEDVHKNDDSIPFYIEDIKRG
jgi:hypothetical protein